ncbi:MAG: patatin-like phospholipase family protein [Nitratireductor sp.]|nr:patatin-like phospholipase family protein [Nitratireductor sp.]
MPGKEPGKDVKEVALVLGGGGARGLAHIPVLEAFDDLGIKPCVIAGTSIGAIIGAAYAAGKSAAEIRHFTTDVLSDRGKVMSRLWKLWPDSFSAMFSGAILRFGELDAEKTLRAFMPEDIPETFEELEIPFKVTATDFYGNSLTVIDRGELFPAVAASIALPFLFRPQIVDGRVHIDGGISNPVAFDLVEAPGRIVVAVDVVGMPVDEDPSRLPSRIEAAFGASQLLMQTITTMKLRMHTPDLLVRPPVDGIRVLDFLHAKTILQKTEGVREQVRADLARLLEG